MGWIDGARIEWSPIGASRWGQCNKDVIRLHWNDYDYRLVPKAPAVEPWTFETVPVGAVVRAKADARVRVVITEAADDMARLATTWHPYENLLDKFEQLNGDPCGTVASEASDWPKWYTNNHGSVWEAEGENGPIWLYHVLGGDRTESVYLSVAGFLTRHATQIPQAEAEALIQKARAGK